MTPDDAKKGPQQLWKPHPDDEEQVAEAFGCADRGELLSPEASEAFVRWLMGEDDESWRAESG